MGIICLMWRDVWGFQTSLVFNHDSKKKSQFFLEGKKSNQNWEMREGKKNSNTVIKLFRVFLPWVLLCQVFSKNWYLSLFPHPFYLQICPLKLIYRLFYVASRALSIQAIIVFIERALLLNWCQNVLPCPSALFLFIVTILENFALFVLRVAFLKFSCTVYFAILTVARTDTCPLSLLATNFGDEYAPSE